VVDSKKL